MKKWILVSVVCASFVVHAENTASTQKQVNEQALRETQNSLTSEVERQKLIQSDAKAKAADAAVVRAVGSGAERDELYKMAADYMKTLSEKANGDPDVMKKEMLNASKNPEAFMKTLPPEMQRRIREIASTIEKKQGVKKDDAPPQP